jgi:hypothetical protein
MGQVLLVPGSLQRVCQLTGEHDRTAGGLVPSRTLSTVRLVGTDLGSSVDLGDRLVFLFGDTWPDRDLGDTVAWTTATEPKADLRLTFATDPSGKKFQTFVLQDRFVPSGQGGTGVFEVPTGGFAREGRLYVVYSQCQSKDRPTMSSSIMCRADDPADLSRLTVLYEVSRLGDSDGRFINAAPVVHRSRPGSPWMVYFWGSGDYRRSYVFLARVPLEEIDDQTKSAWRYWNGEAWKEHEPEAMPLFVDQPPGVGELSAAWVAPLRRWLVTYQLKYPRGVWYRTAQNPTGPYSAARLLYHPDWPGVGYGAVMHRSWDEGGVLGTDMLYDLGRGEEWGAEYGPYIVSRFTRSDGPGRARIAFTLSTWNPYQAHLFAATLELSDTSPPGEPALQPQFVADRPPPTQAGGVSMISSTFGPGNFELAAPAANGGMLLRSRENTLAGMPWDGVARVGLGPLDEADPVHYGAVSMIQSELPNRPDVEPDQLHRLYVAARCGDRVVYLWREAAPPWTWHGPYPVIAVEPDDRRFTFADATGNLALIRSHYGTDQQTWELVSPAAHGGGVLHFWRDNVQADFPRHDDWRLASRFLQSLGTVDAVTMIESQLAKGVFALEVVARVGAQLWFAWRNAAFQWARPFPLEVDGHAVFEVSGMPSLIQSRYGAKGRNFELVTPCAGGGLMHLSRNNDSDDAADWSWGRAAPLLDPTQHYRSASLLQGTFGADPGNLELVARRDDGRVVHFWRDVTTLQWQEPFQVL